LVATKVGVIPEWSPGHNYTSGDIIIDSNGNLEMATATATSTSPGPVAWPAPAIGTITADNGVNWKLFPTGTGLVFPAWNPNQFYLLGAQIIDPNGNLQKVTTQGTSGPNPPGWATSIGSTTTEASGTVVWTLVSPSRLHLDLAETMSTSLNSGVAWSTI